MSATQEQAPDVSVVRSLHLRSVRYTFASIHNQALITTKISLSHSKDLQTHKKQQKKILNVESKLYYSFLDKAKECSGYKVE